VTFPKVLVAAHRDTRGIRAITVRLSPDTPLLRQLSRRSGQPVRVVVGGEFPDRQHVFVESRRSSHHPHPEQPDLLKPAVLGLAAKGRGGGEGGVGGRRERRRRVARAETAVVVMFAIGEVLRR
jgi:hypothetical protein